MCVKLRIMCILKQEVESEMINIYEGFYKYINWFMEVYTFL